MINPLSHNFLINFPPELQHLVAEYLTIDDLNNCLRVSHVWKNLFDSDIMWEPVANKLQVKKPKMNSVHRFLIHTPTIFNRLTIPIRNYLSTDYKSMIHQKFHSEETNILLTYPKELVKLIGGLKAMRKLPEIELTFDKVINKSKESMHLSDVKDEHFSAPIVRGILKLGAKPDFLDYGAFLEYELKNHSPGFLLFRIRNNETKETYREAIGLHTLGERRYFKSKSRYKIITGPYSDVNKQKLDRLKRLIRREPVGMIIEQEMFDFIVEGPRTTDDGKNMLELC